MPYMGTPLVPRVLQDSNIYGGGLVNGSSAAVVSYEGSVTRAAQYLEPARISKRVLQTIAPTSTQWQGFGSYQWSDYQRDMVVKAWGSAKAMASAAATSMDNIRPGEAGYQNFLNLAPACKPTKQGTAEFNNCLRIFIAANHIPYTQMFGADPENLPLLTQNFKTLRDKVEVLGAANRENQLLYLTVSSTVTDIIDGVNQCDGGVQAFVMGAVRVKEYHTNPGVYPPDNAWILNFCPPFFQLPRMEDQLDKLGAQGNPSQAQICNLDALDNAAKCILHEWTHLPWVLNTNAPGGPSDTYGYLKAASYQTAASIGPSSLQKMFTNTFGSKNADNYAWMAVSHFVMVKL
ncbi:MAG: hypothetical protein M1827_004873 [Pycnora praestabilis]|nr:MAG: hypothetical protein M1827_004873 [Pycnora praestabilis]